LLSVAAGRSRNDSATNWDATGGRLN